MKKLFAIILFVAAAFNAYSQKTPERSHARKGNSFYKQGKFNDAETEYRRALQKNPESEKVRYNLANSIYKQGHYEIADSLYKLLIKSNIDSTQPPQTYHNYGNSALKEAIKVKEEQGQHVQANQEKLKESIEAYKKALKLNPDDMETKSNLAYAQKLLAKNGNGGGGGENNNQQNQDKKQNEDKQNQENDNQDNQNDQDNKNEQKQDQNQGQGMNKQDIDRMLEAVRALEEKTKEKVDNEKAMAAKKYTPEKNW